MALVDAVACSDDQHGVVVFDDEVGPGGQVHVTAADDGHDGGTRAGAHQAVGDGPTRAQRAGRDGHALGQKAGDLVVQTGDAFDDPGCAQQLGQRVRLLVGERDLLLAGVGVDSVVDEKISLARLSGDDADAAAAGHRELVFQPDAR